MLAGSVLLAACSHRATHLHSYCQAVCRAGVQAADLSAVMQAHRARIEGIEQAHADRMAALEAKQLCTLEQAAAQHEAALAAQVHLAPTSYMLVDMNQGCLSPSSMFQFHVHALCRHSVLDPASQCCAYTICCKQEVPQAHYRQAVL